MKEGFYLSPDGKHIIELVENRSWKHGYNVISGEYLDLDGETKFIIDDIADMPKECAGIIFSAWERLD